MEPKPLHGWLSGFFDGDGCLYMVIRERSEDRYKVGYSMTPRLRIKHARVAGMVDAEGTLANSISQSQTNTGYHISPQAKVYQDEHDRLMGMLIAYTQKWDVNYNVRLTERDGRRNDVHAFTVSGRENVWRFLRPIKDLLVVKQQQAEILLNEILPRLEEGRHLTKEGFIETMDYVDSMNNLKGGNRGKYNQEYFKQEWGIEA